MRGSTSETDAQKIRVSLQSKHGSWLNMVEIELSVLLRQCFNGRIPNQDILRREVRVWEEERNLQRAAVNCRSITNDARAKLQRLYLSVSQAIVERKDC